MIDTHCHLTSKQFLSRQQEIIDRAELAGVKSMITVATDAQDAIAARDLAEAEITTAALEASVAALTDDLAVATRRLGEAETATSSLTADLADIREASENVLSVRDQNESLRRRLNERDEEAELLAIENGQLRSRSTRDWFVAGAGVLLAGILFGLIVPRLHRRRRAEW